tara:strand:+ start:304 stop:537 length:234 start_codon:yes stop_codon:yes gene_type:complete
MEGTFVITLILVVVVMTILISIIVYRRLYLRNLSYVQQVDQVDVQKEVELPPLGKEWDYDEKQVQSDDDNILIEISV